MYTISATILLVSTRTRMTHFVVMPIITKYRLTSTIHISLIFHHRSQEMLDKVMKWCNLNKLTVNIDKTKCMLINPSSTCEDVPCKITIGTTSLSRVHVYEYLAVHIDDRLNMSNQIDNICKKVQQKHGILKKIRRFISEETALSIYKTMIRPHFDYGDFLIDSGVQSKIDRIDKIRFRIN